MRSISSRRTLKSSAPGNCRRSPTPLQFWLSSPLLTRRRYQRVIFAPSSGPSLGHRAPPYNARSDYTVRAASDLALLRLGKPDLGRLLIRYPNLRGYFEQYTSET